MEICFEKDSGDEFVRILDCSYNDMIILAISSSSKTYPGLWMNSNMKIIGVDLI
jgi:hypothetical protein